MSTVESCWGNRIALSVQGFLACVAWLAGLGLCALALGDNGKLPFFPFGLMLLQWWLALIIHEAGHYVAARSAGMVVLSAVVLHIEIKPLRRGWRIRRCRQRKLHSAYVVAVHDPARPLRGQAIRMTAGGPLANVLVAMAAGAFGLLWTSDVWSPLLLAAAVVNAATGLLNLVPSSRGLGSDGLKLLQWRDRQREHGPDFTFSRLLALVISGVTVDQLPEDQLEALDAQPTPMPLVALWYRLKAQQHLGDWESAAALQLRFEQLEEPLPAEARLHLADLLACIRAELAFSRAVRDRDESHLRADLKLELTAWSLPVLRPRYLALRALLEGKTEEGERWLDEAHRLAALSVDRSLVRSEVMIRSQMRAALMDRENALQSPSVV